MPKLVGAMDYILVTHNKKKDSTPWFNDPILFFIAKWMGIILRGRKIYVL